MTVVVRGDRGVVESVVIGARVRVETKGDVGDVGDWDRLPHSFTN